MGLTSSLPLPQDSAFTFKTFHQERRTVRNEKVTPRGILLSLFFFPLTFTLLFTSHLLLPFTSPFYSSRLWCPSRASNFKMEKELFGNIVLSHIQKSQKDFQ